MTYPRNQMGFTLVEMMVTAALLMILTAIALPSYQGFVAKTVRTQAKSALLQVADRQEQFFLNNKRYSATLMDLGYGADPALIDRDGFEVKPGSGDEVYEVALVGVTPTGFTVNASPQRNQLKADKRCGVLSLDDTGRRASSGPSGDCW